VFVALHVADYERLRLYAAQDARAAIEQVQIERYTLPVTRRIERVSALAASGKRVLVVVGSEERFNRPWRRAFPGASRRAAFPRPGAADAVEVWELRTAP
jgi:hypothetical protein